MAIAMHSPFTAVTFTGEQKHVIDGVTFDENTGAYFVGGAETANALFGKDIFRIGPLNTLSRGARAFTPREFKRIPDETVKRLMEDAA